MYVIRYTTTIQVESAQFDGWWSDDSIIRQLMTTNIIFAYCHLHLFASPDIMIML